MTQAAAVKKMEIVVDGIAYRTVSALNDMVDAMRASGISDDVIRDRVRQELESGPVLAELRRFGAAKVPGFVGDMAFRFARDTQSLEGTRKQVIADLEEELARQPTDDDRARVREALEAYRKQGIDVSAYSTEEFPEPPPDAPLDERYIWIAVLDKRTCSVCSGFHGEEKTLGEWAEVGEPRSGNCYGEDNCRCMLVPAGQLSKKDREVFRDPIDYRELVTDES